ncbi:MAG: hypothetical protein KDK08_03430 [Rhizobiaceae bacterium]|nr:hypothetical protein [Rhizobiaceae bacterium]
MNDKAWSARTGTTNPFTQEAPDDGTYKPWRTSSQGSVRDLQLVPPAASSEPVRFIPYLQAITLEWHKRTGQLCMICHSSGELVFIEGRHLDGLAELVSDKRVKSLHVHDAKEHGPIASNAPVIVALRYERGTLTGANGG